MAQEILPFIRDVPVFVAGGIGRGAAIAMYLGAGASGVQMGTRFVGATECIAHPKFKQAFFRGHARDAVLAEYQLSVEMRQAVLDDDLETMAPHVNPYLLRFYFSISGMKDDEMLTRLHAMKPDASTLNQGKPEHG